MISYIFKNKYKNFAFAFFSGMFFLMQFKFLYKYFTLYGLSDFGQLSFYLFSALSPFLLFLYLLTLKRDYKIKKWLFPFSFFISAVNVILQTINDIVFYCQYPPVQFSSFIIEIIEIASAVIINFIVLAADTFCLIGSLSNFKRIIFLRVGVIVLSIHTVVIKLAEFGRMDFLSPVQNVFFSDLHSYAFYSELFEAILTLLFYLSLLVLVFGKKGADIDIAPYIEARNNKKEMKKTQKSEREREPEKILSAAPDGFWICGGCGKILPNSENRCECGYKRTSSDK